MDKILACPHCGPSLNGSRFRCDRCGRELIYVSQDEIVGGTIEPDAASPSDGRARRIRLWAGVGAAVVAVLALAGFMFPWGGAGGPAANVQPQAAAAGTGHAGNEQNQVPAALAGQDTAAAPLDAATAFRPKDLGQALEHYQAALAAQPSDPVLLDNVGQILLALNRPADAVPLLEQAVGAEPWSVVARFDLAVAYARSGQMAKAADTYAELVRSGSTDPRVYHNEGLALRQLGRNAEAVPAFERATTLAPGEAPAWLGLALSLEAEGRGSEAAAALDRYLALQPAGPEADNARARLARLRAEPAALQPSLGPGGGASRQGP